MAWYTGRSLGRQFTWRDAWFLTGGSCRFDRELHEVKLALILGSTDRAKIRRYGGYFRGSTVLIIPTSLVYDGSVGRAALFGHQVKVFLRYTSSEVGSSAVEIKEHLTDGEVNVSCVASFKLIRDINETVVNVVFITAVAHKFQGPVGI
jgi:hypothetical protein